MAFWCLNCDNTIADKFDYENNICKRCGSSDIYDFPSGITVGEIMLIERISKDKTFIQAIMKLREEDPIEYQLKIAQFKNTVKQSNQKISGQVRCPKCGSTQIQMVKRKWSPLTGFLTNKVDRVCMNCKHKW